MNEKLSFEDFKKMKTGKVALADELILPLLEKINSVEYFCTTSSCAGRIMLLEILSGKKDAKFYMKWHRRVDFDEFWKAVEEYKGKKELWLRCDPLILHLFAKDYASAIEFLGFVKSIGFKRFGLQHDKKHYFMEINGTQGMYLPLKQESEILAGKEYAMFALKKANEKLAKNYSMLEKFQKEFAKKYL